MRLSNQTIDIILVSHSNVGWLRRYVWYYFDIYLHNTRTRVGYIDLRIGYSEYLYYLGNIGYRIEEAYRGHSYAFQACQLVFQYAAKLKQPYLIITCDPNNIPSRRTLEKLQGTFLEETVLPKNHPLYKQGERVKRIYRYDIL